MPCEPMPLLVPISERNAGEACASSKATFTSSSIVSSRPPYCSGIDRPNRPSSRICATSAGGISSLSATCGSAGISASRTKRRTLSSSRERVSSSRIIKVLSAPGTPNDRIVREGCCESAARSGGRMDCAGRSGLGVDQRAERRIGGLDDGGGGVELGLVDQRISRFAGQVGAAGAVAVAADRACALVDRLTPLPAGWLSWKLACCGWKPLVLALATLLAATSMARVLAVMALAPVLKAAMLMLFPFGN